ncbi:hypothetical protein BCV70DRAFT_110360 [Testicularia cyperi]|uniref:Uncharacterized protein n=1 Tax=Testicularia cyperi TaxID=1882483 RepID=A0A317XMS6_9BASI|nr:hypothetical protein BCV70DRAFT_110360 [Testicularia cyperi]
MQPVARLSRRSLRPLSGASVQTIAQHLGQSHLPPAFLAPAAHTELSQRSFGTSAPASLPPPKQVANLRNARRRLGQKFDDDYRPKNDPRRSKPDDRSSTHFNKHRFDDISKSGPDDAARRRIGFRIRARRLTDRLRGASDQIARLAASRTPGSGTQMSNLIDDELEFFESEMRVLRVIIKEAEMLRDPQEAWISATRIKAPYNSAISLCLRNNRIEHAYKLYNRMKKDGIFPSFPTYTILIQGLVLSHLQTNKTDRITPEDKCYQRVQTLYQDVHEMWKSAFPIYFPASGALAKTETRSMMLSKLENATLEPNERRNLLSQQASILEVRDFPAVLTTTLGVYIRFLSHAGLQTEIDQLCDRLFPAKQLERSNTQPGEQTASEFLNTHPVGDHTTLTAFVRSLPSRIATKEQGLSLFSQVERIWSVWSKLIDLEQQHTLTSRPKPEPKPRQHTRQQQQTPTSDAADAAVQSRFVPDSISLRAMMHKLEHAPSEKTGPFVLGLLSKLFRLDLAAHDDHFLRVPGSPTTELVPVLATSAEYLAEDALSIDADRLRLELRDCVVVELLIRVLDSERVYAGQALALFNYIWLRAHEEGTCSETEPFGPSVAPFTVLSILRILAAKADPVAARNLLDAMRKASDSALGEKPDSSASRSQRRLQHRLRAKQAGEASKWVPSDAAYARTMRAILTSLIQGPSGLTVGTPDFDAWTAAKQVLQDWLAYRQSELAGNPYTGLEPIDSSIAKPARPGTRPSKWVEDHPWAVRAKNADGIIGLFLRIARGFKPHRAHVDEDEATRRAREALRLMHARLDVARFIEEQSTVVVRSATRQVEDEVTPALTAFSRSLPHLARTLRQALATADHQYAAKEDVTLWKTWRSMIPGSVEELFDEDPSPNLSSPGAAKYEVRGGRGDANRRSRREPVVAGGGVGGAGAGKPWNKLLLSRADHEELARDDADFDFDFDFDDVHASTPNRPTQSDGGHRFTSNSPALRNQSAFATHDTRSAQRRSRHMQQELDRWVSGASSSPTPVSGSPSFDRRRDQPEPVLRSK